MARLVFGMNQSLDGYVDHTAFAPGPALFRYFIEETRRQAGSIYGRRMPSNARVQVLLAKYIAFGVVPLVIPPLILSVPVPTDLIQHATDYACIRALAVAAGYRFTLDPGPAPGSSIAYWGPEPRPGPEPPFTIDFGRSSVETVQLSFDASALLVTPPQPARAVTGNGTLDVERAGVRLRPGARVDVRGAGNPIDGHFYVNRVRHTIMPDSHTQAFELLRTIPGV